MRLCACGIFPTAARRHVPLFLFPLLPLLAGCPWFGGEIRIDVLLPDPPAVWERTFPSLHARLIRPGSPSGGGPGRRWGESGHAIFLVRGNCVPVLAEPLANGVTLPPCGGLFPSDLDEDGRLPLRWQRGAGVALLLRLVEAGFDDFNADRFCREIEERFPDPWELDGPAAAVRILSGTFRATDLKPLPARILALPLGRGEWFAESPFSPVFPADEKGEVSLRLTIGTHRLFELDGPGLWRVGVGERDVVLKKAPD